MLNEANFGKSFVEVLEIISFLPEEKKECIPESVIEGFENSKDKDYQFKYDENKSYNDQNTLYETKIFLAALFKDYMASTEEKNEIENNIEKNKKDKYGEFSFDKINKEKENKEFLNDIDEGEDNLQIIQEKDISWHLKIKNFFEKIINFLKS